jgi:hypothetical protein
MSQTALQLPMSDQPRSAGNHGGELGAFHYRVVDRFLRRARERLRRKPQEIDVARKPGDGCLGGLRDLRLEALDLCQHGARMEQEVAAVPEIAVGHVIGGGHCVGLLDERLDRQQCGAIELGARPDIAVVRGRVRGGDAEGHDAAGGRRRSALPTSRAKLVRLADDVVGREHEHHRLRIALGGQHRGNRDGGTRVPTHRLEHDIGLDAAFAQLLRHHKAEIRIGDDDRAREQLGVLNAGKHLLEGRVLPDQRHELLRHALARHRPQPRSCAAAHDHRDDLPGHERVSLVGGCAHFNPHRATRQAILG